MPKDRKLIDEISEYTSKGELKKVKPESLKELLDKLKRRQKKLEAQLEQASGRKEKRLKRLIKVIKAQRRKGLQRYEALMDKKG